MKSRKFVVQMLGVQISVLVCYGLLHYSKVLQLPFNLFLIQFIVVPFIFILGTFIMWSGLGKEPEVFVGRFLILTTFQFLAVLSIMAAVWYKMNAHLKPFAFQFLGLFIALMIAQSVLINSARSK